ncbi:flavodoxin family protein [Sphingobacterium faecium]|uniref:flavodoxin family protein n=1 Tax=Sphingobacterium faecium TaxID=34087 RepID=UPI0024690F16|nr:flavodoxin [Sphingobacterium faecium]MDH5827539.1 flavodoxin [Sphingobacterium faecium]
MKAITQYGLLICISLFLMMACTHANDTVNDRSKPHAQKDKWKQSKKILIVYLSRTNNTKAIAKMIHQEVEGDLVAVELIKDYPLDYQTTVNQVARENESGYLPPLKTIISDITQYDIVFIGFPTWGMQLPPPIKSFLNQYDLSGKTVVTFNTNAGYGIGNSFEMVKQLCPNSTILEGFSTKGGKEKEGLFMVMKGDKELEVQANIKKWLMKIGIN